MNDTIDEISLLSDLEDDSISNIVIEQMDIHEIADYIDQTCHECNSTPWTNALIFSSSINGEDVVEQDILKYIDSKIHKQTKKRNVDRYKIYLNPKEYSSDGGYNSNSFEMLSKDLTNASIACGFNVVRNGTRQWKCSNLKMIRFVCCRYRKFRGNTRAISNT